MSEPLETISGARSWVLRVLFDTKNELANAFSLDGMNASLAESRGFSGGVLANKFDEQHRPVVFGPTTIIINSGFAEWEIPVERSVLKRLADMTLRIDTVRTHGMLHSPRKNSHV